MSTTTRTRGAALALCLAACGPAGAQQPIPGQAQALPSPTPSTAGRSGNDQFCALAEQNYGELMNLAAPKADKNPSTAITYGIYRNAAAERILMMVTAARCNLSPFLRLEMSHLNQTRLAKDAGQR